MRRSRDSRVNHTVEVKSVSVKVLSLAVSCVDESLLKTEATGETVLVANGPAVAHDLLRSDA